MHTVAEHPFFLALLTAMLFGISYIPYQMAMEHLSQQSYYLNLACAALIFCGLTALWQSTDNWPLSALFVISSVVLFAAALYLGAGWGAPSSSAANIRKGMQLLILSDVIFLASLFLLNIAFQQAFLKTPPIGVAPIAAIVATNPLFTAMAARLYSGQRLTTFTIIGIVLIVTGIVCISYAAQSTQP